MEQLVETSIFTESVDLHHASAGKRFANYLIDLVSFYVFIFCVFFPIGYMAPEFMHSIMPYVGNGIVSLLMYGLYMGVMETVFQGRSLGKLITGTKTVTEDGINIDARKAMLRGLIRAVPFNGLSGFGYHCNPWHDRWTKTHVIDIKLSVLPL